MADVPANTNVIIDALGYKYIAQYDPKWGGGRGAWFTRKNQIIGQKPYQWRADVDEYVAEYAKHKNFISIR